MHALITAIGHSRPWLPAIVFVCAAGCVPLDYPWFIEEPADLPSACLATRRMYYDDSLFEHRRRPSGNFNGVYLADGRQNPGITAFVAERTSYGTGSANGLLNDAVDRINTISGLTSVAVQAHALQDSPETINRDYTLTLDPPLSLTRLTNQIIRTAGLETAEGSVSNLQPPGSGDDEQTSVRLSLTGQFYNANRVLVFATLVPEEEAELWLADTSLFGDGSNVSDCDSPFSSAGQTFNARVTPPADFLWVVDNSASMSFFQSQLASVAGVFTNALTNAGFSYRLGVITTDNPTPVTTFANNNAFVTDVDEFIDRVLSVGTLGYTDESGIYQADQGLRSLSEGDGFDGYITQAGYPRDGAGFSLVMLSDEPDYYNYYANLYGTPTYNANDNLFINRGYIVNGIIDLDINNANYRRLIRDTGGVASNIYGENFAPAMRRIVANYISTIEGYRLKRNPLSSTITVKVNGNRVPSSASNGWTYNANSNSISFFGSALPAGSDKIRISYIYATSEQ